MKGWNHSLRNDSGAEAAGRGLVHATVEDQLHLIGSADIQIFADALYAPASTRTARMHRLGRRGSRRCPLWEFRSRPFETYYSSMTDSKLLETAAHKNSFIERQALVANL
jgi:hypothetical protein